MTNFIAHGVSLAQAKVMLNGIEKWAKPQSLETPIAVGIASSSIQYQPLGLVLVLTAWDYPIYTVIPQVAAAISAGNGVILKPSELAPYISNALKNYQIKLQIKYFRCIQGKVEIAKKLSSMPFDCICFTGSTVTGTLVAIQAAKNLTPCILELGGKCPVIVDYTANLQSAALRISFGKFLNCGQTCIGVDHVYIHESIKQKFKKMLLETVEEAWGKGQILQEHQHYGKIINIHHTKRISNMLQENHEGKVIYGGNVNLEKRTIYPTIVEQPKKQSLLLNEEIFGPVLPLIYYTDLEDVIKKINNVPKPLVVCLFSQSSKNVQKVKNSTNSGHLFKMIHFFICQIQIYHLEVQADQAQEDGVENQGLQVLAIQKVFLNQLLLILILQMQDFLLTLLTNNLYLMVQ